MGSNMNRDGAEMVIDVDISPYLPWELYEWSFIHKGVSSILKENFRISSGPLIQSTQIEGKAENIGAEYITDKEIKQGLDLSTQK